MKVNNHLKILLYLKQFEGDGQFYEIEHVLPNSNFDQKKAILQELAHEGFIKLIGDEERYVSFFLEHNPLTGKTQTYSHPSNEVIINSNPVLRAKITFKGSRYLKEELEMKESGKYNINITNGNSAINTLVIESKNVNIKSEEKVNEKIDLIIRFVKDDNSLPQERQQEIIATFEEVRKDIQNTGKLSEPLLKRVLSIGDQVSSIGSLILSLLSNL